MRQGPLILFTALLLQAAAMAQTSPTLQMTQNNGVVSISWSNATNLYSLQKTTLPSHPVVWADQQLASGAGNVNISNGGSQAFFRLAPVTPLFQHAIFYNVNMEIDPGGAMSITGPVFCNQNIWEGSSVCTFDSSVSAVGTNAPQAADPFANNFTGGGIPTFSGGQPTSHAPPLSFAGSGTNYSPAAMRSILELPPAAYGLGTPAAYSSAGSSYIANQADLVISNFVWGTNSGIVPSGTNFVAWYQDGGLYPLPYDYYVVTNATGQAIVTNYVGGLALGGIGNANIFYAGYTWLTNVCFYDWREGWNGGAGPAKKVQAAQIDMGLLNKWLTNAASNGGYAWNQAKWTHANHYIGGIYVYTSVPLSSSQLPAVRVTDGAILPNPYSSTTPYGVTVATPFPLYVWKDYNSATFQGSSLGLNSTAYTVPAALMGDSVTVLSDSWIDQPNPPPKSPIPNPSNTTVNAAMVAGIVPSNLAIAGSYSGGVENFMRLLENWGGTLTFNGSIVVPFYSKYATNSWQPTGNYYNAPTRHWAHDQNFNNYSKLPPLTPVLENYLSP